LKAKFGQEVCNKRVYKTPGTPRFKIVRPAADDDVIDADLQGRYRSAVRILFCLTKYSQPDLFNVVRELAKCMDNDQNIGLVDTFFEEPVSDKSFIETYNLLRPYAIRLDWQFNEIAVR
jgi:hypothetical protein